MTKEPSEAAMRVALKIVAEMLIVRFKNYRGQSVWSQEMIDAVQIELARALDAQKEKDHGKQLPKNSRRRNGRTWPPDDGTYTLPKRRAAKTERG